MNLVRAVSAAFLLVTLCGVAHGQAQSIPLAPLTMTAAEGPRHFTTEHRGIFNGRRIRYEASVDETLIQDKAHQDKAHQPIATLFTFSYIAKGLDDPATRPVLFVFNGGPGGASSALHFSGVGPKRLTSVTTQSLADPSNQLIDNPLSPLDVTDLVFIDPTDTGWSRTSPGTPWSTLYSVDGDSDCISAFIVHWLQTHGRTSSAVFIWGESYGTMRAVALARDLTRSATRINLGGLIFTGPAITYGTGPKTFDPIRAALLLPMMASLAYHYGKIDAKNQTWEQAVEKARAFGRSDYLQALMKGYNLAPADKEKIITRLPQIIGIPEAYFRAHDTILVADFNSELLKDQGLVLDGNNGLDTHKVADAPGEDHTRDFAAEFAGLTAAMERYAHDDLRVTGLGPYYTVTPAPMRLFDQWNFTPSGTPTLDIVLAKAFADNPGMRVLVLQGRYDTLSTLGVTEYTMDQTNIPRERYTSAYFDGGHVFNGTPEAMAAVRSFLTR